MPHLMTQEDMKAAFTAPGRELGGHNKMLSVDDRSKAYRDFAATAPRPQKHSRKDPFVPIRQKRYPGTFFYLPRKARDLVYRHLLVSKGHYITTPSSARNAMIGLVEQCDHVINVDIFLTCRKVGAEASKIFYNENAFRLGIPGPSAGNPFLNHRDFHPNLPRIRKCWLDVNYPRLDITLTPGSSRLWVNALDLNERTHNLVRVFARALDGDHAMQLLQIVVGVNTEDERAFPIEWRELLRPLAQIRQVAHVRVSGNPDLRFRHYLEDVMSRDEAWGPISFLEWVEQTVTWTKRGDTREKDRINLFKEIVPRDVATQPEAKGLKQAVASMGPDSKRPRGRPPKKVHIVEIEGTPASAGRSGL